MSTRCTVTIADESDTFTIYRHCDGYPEGEHGVLAALREALPYAWPLPRFEASDFAAAVVAAWKRPARATSSGHVMQGGNIHLTTGRDAHGDTEWHYDVRQCKNLTIRVLVYERTGNETWTVRSKLTHGLWKAARDMGAAAPVVPPAAPAPVHAAPAPRAAPCTRPKIEAVARTLAEALAQTLAETLAETLQGVLDAE